MSVSVCLPESKSECGSLSRDMCLFTLFSLILSLIMPKHQCKLREEYSKKWEYIKKRRYDNEAECTVCNSDFSIAHGERSDLKQHIA